MSYARYTVVRLLYLNLMFFALINEGLKRKKLNWSIWTGLGKRQKTTENSQKMENASLFLLDSAGVNVKTKNNKINWSSPTDRSWLFKLMTVSHLRDSAWYCNNVTHFECFKNSCQTLTKLSWNFVYYINFLFPDPGTWFLCCCFSIRMFCAANCININ